MKNIILFIKGFIIGIGKIVPGVSGALIAISLGVYEKSLESLTEILKKPLTSIKYLLPLGLGAVISISLLSSIINYLIVKYYMVVILFFSGLILGGIPSFAKKVNFKKNQIYGIIAFLFPLLIGIFKVAKNDVILSNDIESFFLVIAIGVIEAFTMIIPGISGTALFLLLGLYRPLLKILASIINIGNFSPNMYLIIPYFFGILIGVLIISKLMIYLLKNHTNKINYMILGFSLSSVMLLLKTTLNIDYNINTLILGLILLPIGYKISHVLEK